VAPQQSQPTGCRSSKCFPEAGRLAAHVPTGRRQITKTKHSQVSAREKNGPGQCPPELLSESLRRSCVRSGRRCPTVAMMEAAYSRLQSGSFRLADAKLHLSLSAVIGPIRQAKYIVIDKTRWLRVVCQHLPVGSLSSFSVKHEPSGLSDAGALLAPHFCAQNGLHVETSQFGGAFVRAFRGAGASLRKSPAACVPYCVIPPAKISTCPDSEWKTREMSA
jgi:hypothetical protein